MSLLAASPTLSFTELRDTLQMTDGNIVTHIRTLQDAGFVAVTKQFRDSRPLTTCQLTSAGRAAFSAHLALLEQIIRQNKPHSR